MKQPIPSGALLLMASVVLGCGENPVEQTGDPGLTFAADSVSVNIGAFTAVSVSLSNIVETPQYVSRDLSVATVNANGSIKGVAVGSTYIVATLPSHTDVSDSVRVRVSVDTCALARPDFGGAATAADRALFTYDINAPLILQKTVESAQNGVQVSSISYTSPDGGMVTGIIAEPIGRSGLRPGIVILPPSGGGAKGMTPYSQILAKHGAVVIAIDAPYWRRGGTSIPLFTGQDRTEQIQLIKDLQRAVDVLRANPNVDHERIGFEGYSYGGIIGAKFVGIERRLKAAVLAAAHGGQVTGITTSINLGYLAANVTCATRNAWFRAMVPIEPIRFISNASPTQLLFQIAMFDVAVLPEDAQALYSTASNPKDVLFYNTGHSFNPQALYDRHYWLHQKLGIDAPATVP